MSRSAKGQENHVSPGLANSGRGGGASKGVRESSAGFAECESKGPRGAVVTARVARMTGVLMATSWYSVSASKG